MRRSFLGMPPHRCTSARRLTQRLIPPLMPPHRRKTARSAIRTVRVRFQAAFRRPADTRFLLLSNIFHKTARKHLIFPVLSYIMVRHSRDTRSRASHAAAVPRPICPLFERYISRTGGKNSISCHVARSLWRSPLYSSAEAQQAEYVLGKEKPSKKYPRENFDSMPLKRLLLIWLSR